MKTLLIRLDRIGDLVLTLPVDQSPKITDFHWLIPQGLGWILQHSEPKRPFTEIEKTAQGFWSLLQFLKQNQFEQAVVFHGPWWVGLALWWSGVKVRAGRRSQWHSYLFFNRGLRQKRSRGERHETAYNWELLHHFLKSPTPQKLPPALILRSSLPARCLDEFNLSSKSYGLIHPGMGGSALNWSTASYAQLIRKAMDSEVIVITGTKGDRAYTEPLFQQLKGHPQIQWLHEKLNPQQLLLVLAEAKWVLAPSTGVVHLAASLGTRTLGLYSPLSNERSLRWGPRGHQVKVLEGHEGADPMSAITVDQTWQSLQDWSL